MESSNVWNFVRFNQLDWNILVVDHIVSISCDLREEISVDCNVCHVTLFLLIQLKRFCWSHVMRLSHSAYFTIDMQAAYRVFSPDSTGSTPCMQPACSASTPDSPASSTHVCSACCMQAEQAAMHVTCMSIVK